MFPPRFLSRWLRTHQYQAKKRSALQDRIRPQLEWLESRYAPAAPGGVGANLQLWLKADAGVTEVGGTVSQWNDQSANGTQATQGTPTAQPTLVDDAVNFNPLVRFDGADDVLILPDANLPAGTSARSFFAVLTTHEPSGTLPGQVFSYGTGNDGRTWRVTANVDGFGLNSSNDINSVLVPMDGIPTVTGLRHAAGETGHQVEVFVNGVPRTPNDAFQLGTFTLNTNLSGTASVGQDSTAGAFFDGDIAELIVFDREVTDAERAQIESYLALKYGITQINGGGVDYFNSLGTILWDAGDNAAYHNDVAGIGRDDAGELDQRQSRSVNSDALVTIDHGGTFVNDQAFLLWGNDNGATTFGTTVPGTNLNRLARLWTVEERGTIENVTLRVAQSLFGDNLPVLMRSTDAIFDSSDEQILLTDDGNGDFEATIDFNDGDFFSFAQGPTADSIVGISDVSITEGNSATTNLTFTITRTGDLSSAIEIDYQTADAGVGPTFATACEDYTAISRGSVIMPAGASLVTVDVPIVGDMAFERDETFRVQITAVRTPFFLSHQRLPGGGEGSREFASADLDMDGDLDVVLANEGNGTTTANVQILQNNTSVGASTLDFAVAGTLGVQPPLGPNPRGVVLADFNNDGLPDLAVANATPGTSPSNIQVLENISSGGTIAFGNQQALVTRSVNTFGVAAADLDGDGRLDIVINSDNFPGSGIQGGRNITFFRNLSAVGGPLTFAVATKTGMSIAGRPKGAVVGNLNGDGRPDVLISRVGGATSVIPLRNQSVPGTISFVADAGVGTGDDAREAILVDINRDGLDDMVVASRNSNQVFVRLNTSAVGGAITFGTLQTLTVGNPHQLDLGGLTGGPTDASTRPSACLEGRSARSPVERGAQPPRTPQVGVTALDYDGDGDHDLVVANAADGTISVLLNETPVGANTAVFTIESVFAAGTNGILPHSGDFNGDGKPDVILVNGTDAIGFTVGGLVNNSFPDPAIGQSEATGTILNDDSESEIEVSLDGSGNLVITDLNASNDSLTIQADTTNNQFIITDSNLGITTAIQGATGDGTNSVVVPFVAVTGSQVLINTGAGEDSVTLDFSLGNFTQSILYDGGTQICGDSLILTGGAFASAVFNFTDENSGSINLTGNATINYLGLELITSTITANDVTLNYSNASETITFSDSGTGGQTTVDSDFSGAVVIFNNPTNSLTTNSGEGMDIIHVDGFGSGFDASLLLDGQGGVDTANLNAGVALASGNSLSVTAEEIRIASNQAFTISGAGTITLDADHNIILHTGSSLTTTDGAITLTGNGNGGTLSGVSIDGATVQSSNGDISITGTGVGSSGQTQGIQILNQAMIRSTGTGANAGTITLQGTGDPNGTLGGAGGGSPPGVQLLSGNHGILLDDAIIDSIDGDIGLLGTGGGSGSTNSQGVALTGGTQVHSLGTTVDAATITITGTTLSSDPGSNGIVASGAIVEATGSGAVALHSPRSISAVANSRFSTASGTLTLEANSAGTTSGSFIGISVTSSMLTSGTGDITLTGHGGDTGGFQHGVRFQNVDSGITSLGGDITITGTGGTNTGDFSDAIDLAVSGGVSTTGSGTITFTGMVDSSSNGSDGLTIGETLVTSVDGDIIITGNTTSNTANGVQLLGVGAQVQATGAGSVSLTSLRNILLTSGSGISTNSGAITLEANTLGTTSGNFAGIELDAGDITTNTGAITLTGTGGHVGTFNRGVYIRNGSVVSSTGTGSPGAITITGQGGKGGSFPLGGGGAKPQGPVMGVELASNHPTLSAPAQITSMDADITITGTGGNAGVSTDALGIEIRDGVTVRSTGGGSISITGTGGTGGQFNHGLRMGNTIHGTSSINTVATNTGDLVVTGTAGTGSNTSAILTRSTVLEAAVGDLTVNTDGLILINTTLQGSGDLTIQPLTPSASIGLGGGPGTLHLDDSELASFADGFASITIGATNGTATVNINSVTFNDSTTLIGGIFQDNTGTDITAPTVTLDGIVSPGKGPGILSIAGDFVFADRDTFAVELGGTTPGETPTSHDQLNVTGLVTVGNNVTLDLSALPGFTPNPGDSFILVNNDGTDAITGTFQGIPEGTLFTDLLGSGLDARLTYAGGDGNDVVLAFFPTVTLSVDQPFFSEANEVVTITATTNAAFIQDVLVDVAFSGTATDGVDYMPSPKQIGGCGGAKPPRGPVLVIPAGMTTGNITVTATQDTIDEFDETLVVDITSVTNGTEDGVQQVSTTLLDDDQTILQIADATLVEGDAGTANLDFTLTRSGDTSNGFTANLATIGDGESATAGTDYTSQRGTVTFAPGQTTAVFSVPIVGENLVELEESFRVDITGAKGTNAPTPILGAGPLVESVDWDAENRIDGTGLGVLPSGITVTYTTATAGNAGIFLPINWDVSPVSDGAVGPGLTNLEAGVLGSTVGTQQQTITFGSSIVNPILYMNFATDGMTFDFGSLNVQLLDGNNALLIDSLLTFPRAVNTANDGAVVRILGTFGPGTPLQFDMSTPAPFDSVAFTIGQDVATGTILNNDQATLSLADAVVMEGDGGTTQLVFDVVLDNPVDVPLTVDFATADGSATVSDGDYISTQGTLNFAGNAISSSSLTQQVNVPLQGDDRFELDETFQVLLTSLQSSGRNVTVSDGVAEGTILNDDLPPSVTLSSSQSTLAEAADVVTLTASLDRVSGLDVTVELGFAGSAGLGEDYSVPANQIVVPAGSSSAFIQLMALQDLLDEPDEEMVVDIVSLANGTESGVGQVALTIVDDDPLPVVSLSVSSAFLSEANGSSTLTASLDVVSGRDVTVDLDLGGLAIPGTDFTANGSVVIPAGSLSASIPLTVENDQLDEDDESLTVGIASAVNGQAQDTAPVELVLVDDDEPPQISLSINQRVVGENNESFIITVSLSAVSGRNVLVELEVGGTATIGQDFVVSVGNVTLDSLPVQQVQMVIPAGELSNTLIFTSVSDGVDEGAETIFIRIASADGALVGSSDPVDVTLLESEPAQRMTAQPVVPITPPVTPDTIAATAIALSQPGARPPRGPVVEGGSPGTLTSDLESEVDSLPGGGSADSDVNAPDSTAALDLALTSLGGGGGGTSTAVSETQSKQNQSKSKAPQTAPQPVDPSRQRLLRLLREQESLQEERKAREEYEEQLREQEELFALGDDWFGPGSGGEPGWSGLKAPFLDFDGMIEDFFMDPPLDEDLLFQAKENDLVGRYRGFLIRVAWMAIIVPALIRGARKLHG